MATITVTSPSGIFSNAMLHIIQGFEALGIHVLTDINVPINSPENKLGKGGANIFPPYSVLEPVLFRNKNYEEEAANTLLLVDVTACFPDLWEKSFQYILRNMTTRQVVVFNMADNCTLMHYPSDWIVFSANHSFHANMGGRQFPFPLGVSRDLLTVIDQKTILKKQKNGKILRNFRPSWNQNVRDVLDLALVPALSRFFTVDYSNVTKDLDEYIDQMSSASAVLAYGGQFIWDKFDDSHEETVHLKLACFRGPVEIVRWDGWRYYETCAFGTCPVHLDFEKYGFALPKPPAPWREYIPIDLEEVSFLPQRLSDAIARDPNYLADIGLAARQWLIENYSPVPLARYVLTTLIEEGVVIPWD